MTEMWSSRASAPDFKRQMENLREQLAKKEEEIRKVRASRAELVQMPSSIPKLTASTAGGAEPLEPVGARRSLNFADPENHDQIQTEHHVHVQLETRTQSVTSNSTSSSTPTASSQDSGTALRDVTNTHAQASPPPLHHQSQELEATSRAPRPPSADGHQTDCLERVPWSVRRELENLQSENAKLKVVAEAAAKSLQEAQARTEAVLVGGQGAAAERAQLYKENLDQRQELTTAHYQIEQLQKELDETKRVLAAADGSHWRSQMLEMETEMKNLKDSKFQAECRASSTATELEQTRSRLGELESTNAALLEEAGHHRREQAALHASLLDSRDQQARLKEAATKLEESSAAQTEHVATLANDLHSARVKLAEAEGRLEAMHSHIATVKSQVESSDRITSPTCAGVPDLANKQLYIKLRSTEVQLAEARKQLRAVRSAPNRENLPVSTRIEQEHGKHADLRSSGTPEVTVLAGELAKLRQERDLIQESLEHALNKTNLLELETQKIQLSSNNEIERLESALRECRQEAAQQGERALQAEVQSREKSMELERVQRAAERDAQRAGRNETRAQDEMKALKDERDKLEASAARLAADKELLTARVAGLEESQTDLHRDIIEAKNEHQHMQRRLLSAQGGGEHAQRELARLQHELAVSQAQNSELQGQLSSATEAAAEQGRVVARSLLEAQVKASSTSATVLQVREQLEAEQQRRAAMELEVAAAAKVLATERSTNDALQARLEAQHVELAEAQANLKMRDSKLEHAQKRCLALEQHAQASPSSMLRNKGGEEGAPSTTALGGGDSPSLVSCVDSLEAERTSHEVTKRELDHVKAQAAQLQNAAAESASESAADLEAEKRKVLSLEAAVSASTQRAEKAEVGLKKTMDELLKTREEAARVGGDRQQAVDKVQEVERAAATQRQKMVEEVQQLKANVHAQVAALVQRAERAETQLAEMHASGMQGGPPVDLYRAQLAGKEAEAQRWRRELFAERARSRASVAHALQQQTAMVEARVRAGPELRLTGNAEARATKASRIVVDKAEQVAREEETLASHQARLAKVEQEMARASAQMQTLQVSTPGDSAALGHLEHHIQQLSSLQAQARSETQLCSTRLKQLEDDLEELIHRLEPPGSSDQVAASYSIASIGDASQVKALARVGPQYNIVSAELDHLRKQVGVLEEEAAARERALAQASEERRMLQAKLQDLKHQLVSVKNKPTNKAIPLSEIVPASLPDFNQYNELRARVDQLHSLMTEAKKHDTRPSAASSKEESPLVVLRQAHQTLEKQHAQLQEQCQAHRVRIQELELQLQKWESRHEEAMRLHKDQLQNNEQRQQKLLGQIYDQHQKSMEEITKSHQADIAAKDVQFTEQDQRHKELVDKATKDHERGLSLLRAEFEAREELEAARREVAREEAARRARAHQEQREEMDQITQKQQQELAEQRQRVREAELLVQQVTAELASTVAETSAASKVAAKTEADLRSQIASCEDRWHAAQSQAADMEAEVANARDAEMRREVQYAGMKVKWRDAHKALKGAGVEIHTLAVRLTAELEEKEKLHAKILELESTRQPTSPLQSSSESSSPWCYASQMPAANLPMQLHPGPPLSSTIPMWWIPSTQMCGSTSGYMPCVPTTFTSAGHAVAVQPHQSHHFGSETRTASDVLVKGRDSELENLRQQIVESQDALRMYKEQNKAFEMDLNAARHTNAAKDTYIASLTVRPRQVIKI